MIVINTRQDCCHPEAGLLKHGPNEVPDKIAQRLLEAGKYSGDFVPGSAPEITAEAVATGLVGIVEMVEKPKFLRKGKE